MAHIENRSTLLNAQRTLMSIGLDVLDKVKVQGFDLAIDPLPMVKKGDAKHGSITINVLRNGRPTDDEKAIATVAERIEEIMEKRHPSEKEAVAVKGLTISMKSAAEVAKAKAPKELPPRGSTNRRAPRAAAAPAAPPAEAPAAEGSTNGGSAAE